MSLRPRRVSLLAAVAALTTGLALLAPSTATAAAPDPDPAPAPTAEQALETVQEIFGGFQTRKTAPSTTSRADATIALRDLALLSDQLSPTDQELAARYFARPTDGDDPYVDYGRNTEAKACGVAVCIHYVTTGQHKVATTDTAPANGTPDYVDFALATMTDVHGTYVAAGYRPPLPDGDVEENGGDARTDIYLGEIGPQGLYGYCTKDADSSGRTVPAYCVLDNDYSSDEFPTNTPTENLQVTAAHEYFHAVQFGYDFREDGWFLEATATWAEDELFDDVDDNVFYLQDSPLTRPRKSMDQFGGLFHYGVWSFFRYLTERYPAAEGDMPTLVRQMWEAADAAPGGPDEYSLQAVETVLTGRGQALTDAFARFAQANRFPGRNYEEGAANDYPAAPLVDQVTLSQKAPSSGTSKLTLDHLSSGTVRYVPGSTLPGRLWRLRVDLDLMGRAKQPAALVTVMRKEGGPRVMRVSLDSQGDARKVVQFSSSTVKYVELTVVNASDHFACGSNREFSCEGRPKDDNRVQEFTARAVKAS